MDDKLTMLSDAFDAHQKRRRLSLRTMSNRRRVLERFADYCDPLNAAPADIDAWLDTCAVEPDSRATYVVDLRAFYVWAVDEGWLPADPTRRLAMPRRRRRMPRPIPPEELEPAIADADARMRCWLLLGCLAGLRCCEIAWLTVPDVMWWSTPPALFVSGKGGHERIVPINPRLAAALRVSGLPDDGPCFPIQGRAARPGTISAYITRHLRGYGIFKGGHRLRHCFGTSVYQLSKDLRLTQELLGHEDPRSTAIYAAFAQSDAAEVINRL